ncbi:hypothetical protein M427DRAFT_392254 [Gonapodya prolifera JEL478]|uniref:Uncharacterized protein n=1 Tax=Gonapodya prolifera (strain JEL478) TaxID=1344416 RepID=A0A139A0K3_GONPJ|nr:hypothetical protein M427DRAFT_74333 [Gonapodya prolifera JEL478]KXS12575.1 hypothetical protein M427DRAFT_392254 [Gonapodya prolifera JEL478]|eukprot:KXS10254.1 hypothetical protein M427DRAFT_74333 [Gonapodya prolifera JEL478]
MTTYLHGMMHSSWNDGNAQFTKALRDLLDFKNQQLEDNKRKRPDGQIGLVAFKEAKRLRRPLSEKVRDEEKLLYDEALPALLATIKNCSRADFLPFFVTTIQLFGSQFIVHHLIEAGPLDEKVDKAPVARWEYCNMDLASSSPEDIWITIHFLRMALLSNLRRFEE